MLDPRKVDEHRKFFAEFNAILKGDLAKEYDRVRDLIKEWDKRANLEEEKRLLKQATEDHEAVVAKFEKQSTKYTADMKTWHANLTQKETDLKAREQAVAQKEYQVSDGQAQLEAKTLAVAKSQDAKGKELAKKESDLNDLQSALLRRDKELTAKYAKVDAVAAAMASMR
jgi:chromosome segregation ATPase